MGALFDGVKERVSARDAAEKYIGLSRNGKALCPWHPDNHPSLSFDRRTGRCKCFSCSNGGSSIDLVMEVFGLSCLEAAKKINADFGLGLDSSPAPPPRGKSKGQWQREFSEWFREEHKRLYHEKERLEKLAETECREKRHSRYCFHKRFRVECIINRQEKMTESSAHFPSACFGFYGADEGC